VTGATFRPGTVLARRFGLEDLLDENDGAGFWRATDRVLARSVAVHVLAVTDPRCDALLTAARRSALVTDGHLLRVLDAASEDGVAYVVHEWGSGVSLDRMLVEGPLSPRRAAWLAREVAECICVAHRHDVAHGRLLPENVLISETGSVKLIGFAVDAVLRGTGARAQLATTGAQIGDRESDVVNLAGLLYAGLVGRWPGTTGSTVPVAPTEHGCPLRPRQVRAGIPRSLDAICERVLNPDAHVPAMETALEVYAALSDYIGDPGTAAMAVNSGSPDTEELPEASGSTGSEAAEPTTVLDRGDLVDPGDAADPEATQAGAPLFLDGVVGWMPAEDHRSAAPVTPTPPPPPPTEPERRPLFADEPAKTPTAGSAGIPAAGPAETHGIGTSSDTFGTRSTGAGNGPVPSSWGPDAERPGGPPWDDPDEPGDDGVPGRSWLRAGVVLATVLIVVVAAAVALTLNHRTTKDNGASAKHTAAGGKAGTSARGTRLPISGVTDFDPQGHPPEENPDLTRLAHDGDPKTAWETNTYYNDPHLGGLKSGVGLLVDLGKRAGLGEVDLTLQGKPTSLQLLAAPDAHSAPSSTDGLSTVATAKDAGTHVDLVLKKQVTTRWLVVWLTKVPPAPGGYQGKVAEISVRS
jgi:Protein kinase domain